KKSDISIDFKEIKVGRAVKKIKFTIEQNNNIMEILPKVVHEGNDQHTPSIETVKSKEAKRAKVELFTALEEDDILEIHNLALEIGFTVNKTVIKQWLKFGKEKVIRIMESIRYNTKIENPIGFIFS